MDKETDNLLSTVAQKAASEAVAKLREFHQDDLKVLGERIDIGFEKVNNELLETNSRLDRVEHGLQETNSRLDRVEHGLQENNSRLDRVEHELRGTNSRLDRVENALTTLLQEFKTQQGKQRQLEAMIVELTERVALLETQFARSNG
jgi:chromosome segregation ATPase